MSDVLEMESRKLRRRLLVVVVVIPLFLLGGYVFWLSLESEAKAQRYSEPGGIEDRITYTTLLSDIVQQLQVERGRSASWMGNQADNLREALGLQRTRTDSAIQGLKAFSEQRGIDEDSMVKLDRWPVLLSKLSAHRSAIDNNAVNLKEAMAPYTHLIAAILTQIWLTRSDMREERIERNLQALEHLLQAIEAMGQERALVSNALAARSLQESSRTQILELLATQESRLETFQNYAEGELKKRFEHQNTSDDAMLVRDLRDQLLANDEKVFDRISAFDFFATATRRIEALFAIEDLVIERLKSAAISGKVNANTSAALQKALAAVLIVLALVTGMLIRVSCRKEARRNAKLGESIVDIDA